MLSAQKGFCALCRVEEATDLDHDHTSGTIRGILCHSCNKGLGYFKDDPKIMKRAIAYIRGAKRGSES